MSVEFNHISVLLEESVNLLEVKADGTYADGTLGGGGHSSYICSKLSDGGRLIGIDRDMTAINAASQRLEKFDANFTAVHDNFANIKEILNRLGIYFYKITNINLSLKQSKLCFVLVFL